MPPALLWETFFPPGERPDRHRQRPPRGGDVFPGPAAVNGCLLYAKSANAPLSGGRAENAQCRREARPFAEALPASYLPSCPSAMR